MSVATHTRGPWKAGYYSSVVGLPVVAQPDPKQNTIIICGVRGDRAEAEANARLIAAAPDMLTLLVELIDIEGPQPGTSAWATKVKSVVAAAKGAV